MPKPYWPQGSVLMPARSHGARELPASARRHRSDPSRTRCRTFGVRESGHDRITAAGCPGDGQRNGPSAYARSGRPSQPSSCLPDVGRFLAVLAAGCRGGRIGEIGPGSGVGAAWLASAMPGDCVLTTVAIDEKRAAAAALLPGADHRIEVLTGDARNMLPARGTFDLTVRRRRLAGQRTCRPRSCRRPGRHG
jgi:hypothetical protein